MAENNKTRITLKVGLSRTEREQIARNIEENISVQIPTSGTGPENFYPGNSGVQLARDLTSLRTTLESDYVLKSEIGNIGNFATKSEVQTISSDLATLNNTVVNDYVLKSELNALTNGANGLLDTFKEIGDALGNDANFADTMKQEFKRLDVGLDALKVYSYVDRNEMDDHIAVLPSEITKPNISVSLVSISARSLNNLVPCIILGNEHDINYSIPSTNTTHSLIHFNEDIYLYGTGLINDQEYYGYDRIDFIEGIIERHCLTIHASEILSNWGSFVFGSSTNTIKIDSINNVLGIDIRPKKDTSYVLINNSFPQADGLSVEVNNGAIRFKSSTVSNKTTLKAYLESYVNNGVDPYIVLLRTNIIYDELAGKYSGELKYLFELNSTLTYDYTLPTLQFSYLSSSELIYTKEQIDNKFATLPDTSKLNDIRLVLTLADGKVHYLYSNLGSSTVKEELTDIVSNNSSSLFIVQLATKTTETSAVIPETTTADISAWIAEKTAAGQNDTASVVTIEDKAMTVTARKDSGSSSPGFIDGQNNQLRIYKNNSLEISINENYKIHRIYITSAVTGSNAFSSEKVTSSGIDTIDTVGRVSTITVNSGVNTIRLSSFTGATYIANIACEYYDASEEMPDDVVETTTIIFSNEYGIYRPTDKFPYLEKVYDITPDMYVLSPVENKNVYDLYQGRGYISGDLPIDVPGNIDNFFALRIKTAEEDKYVNLENGSGTNAIQQKQSDKDVNFVNPNYTPSYTYEVGAFGKDSFMANGNSMAKGELSTAFGRNTLAEGTRSFASGTKTAATGNNSHAEGIQTLASGDNGAHAEGNATVSSGYASHAEGNNTKAQGSASHSEGTSTIAFGNYSHSGGRSSEARGEGSFAHGYGIYVNQDYQVSFGKYNKVDSNVLFSIGDGTSDNARSNAFEIYADGTLGIPNFDSNGNKIGMKKIKCINGVLTVID